MARSGPGQKVANSLVVMSSAAVLAVYSAGYVRTRPAADKMAAQVVERSLSLEMAPAESTPGGSAAQPAPIAPVREHIVSVTPKVSESPAPVNAHVQVSSAEPASLPAVTAPAPAPAAPVIPVTEQAPAEVSAPAASAPAASVSNGWKDGKYVGWGGSRHGDIQATVVIEGGRIISADISDCQTRYPCDVIEKLPPQVVKRQSPNVDRVGGATESADAFYSAVFFALKQAK